MAGFLDTLKEHPELVLAPGGALSAYFLDKYLNRAATAEPGEEQPEPKTNWLYPVGGALLGYGMGRMLAQPAKSTLAATLADFEDPTNSVNVSLNPKRDVKKYRSVKKAADWLSQFPDLADADFKQVASSLDPADLAVYNQRVAPVLTAANEYKAVLHTAPDKVPAKLAVIRDLLRADENLVYDFHRNFSALRTAADDLKSKKGAKQ